MIITPVFLVGITFLFLFLPVGLYKLEPAPKLKTKAQPYKQEIATLFSPDQILVKFDPSISDEQQKVIAKAIIEKPMKVRIEKSTGKVIQQLPGKQVPEGSIEKETIDLKVNVKKMEKIYPETSIIKDKVTQNSNGTNTRQNQVESPVKNWQVIKLSAETDIIGFINDLGKDKRIIDAQPNYIYQLYFTPSDPYYSSKGSWGQDYDDLWGIKKIDSSSAWDTNINFTVLRGDVNRDQTIDANDVDFLDNYLNSGGPAPDPLLLGDVDNNAQVNADDLTYLSNYISGSGPAPQGDSFGPVSAVAAVVDTGVDYTHPDIKDKIWTNEDEIPNNGIDDDSNGFIDDVHGWDFAGLYGESPDNDPMDYHGHGTHVSGTIAATINNGIGVAGICRECKIMPVKASDDHGGLSSSSLTQALLYAANNGAKVVNNSWGGLLHDQVIQDAIDEAYTKGVTLVFAAGNSDMDIQFSFPKSDNLIKVAASGPDDTPTWFTNFGSRIDVAAPGLDILSLRAKDTDMYWDGEHNVGTEYYRASGTSMAAPHVVGVISLILSQNPYLNQEELRSILRFSADDIHEPGWDKKSGYGRINAFKALTSPYPCVSKITSPTHWSNLKDLGGNTINIQGTASCKNFSSYKLEYGEGSVPISWNTIAESLNSVSAGNLATNWDISALVNGDYTLKLTAIDSAQNQFIDRVFVRITAPLHAGFPLEIFASHLIFPTIDDIGEDSKNEIIIPPYVLRDDGTIVWSINEYEMINTDSSTAATGDLDLSYPGKEIVFLTDGYIHIVHADGTEIKNSNWPKALNVYLPEISPVLADLDQNGQLEIIISEDDWLYVWNFDGSYAVGWPKNVIGGNQVSVGNVDDDPQLELSLANSVFNYDGSLLNQDEEVFDSCWGGLSSPMADFDGDGKDEIVCSSYDWWGESMTVTLLNIDGSILYGWPQTVSVGDTLGYFPYILPTIADLNNDERPEIIIAAGSFVYAFDYQGQFLPGWPVSDFVFLNSNPLVVDIDEDQDMEVLASSWFNQIFAYHHDGSRVDGYPLILPNQEHLQWSGPAIGDIDGDGQFELIGYSHRYFGFDGEVSVYDISGSKAGWPQYHYDATKTGNPKGFLLIDDNSPPVISNVITSNLTTSSAVISWGTDEPATSQIEYGLTTSYGLGAKGVNNLVTNHSVNLTNLNAGITYHFSVKSRDTAGNEATSNDFTFTTKESPDTTPPIISNVNASNTTNSSTVISWTTNEPATSQVEYGLSTSYGSNTTEDSNLVTSHIINLTNLNPSETYHFRVKSKDSKANEAVSQNFTFATQASPSKTDNTPPDSITDLRIVDNDSSDSATLTWTAPGDDGSTGQAALYDLRYSTSNITDSNWNQATQGQGEPVPHTVGYQEVFIASGLKSSTTYYFAVKTSDEAGNWSGLSNIVSRTTSATPPVSCAENWSCGDWGNCTNAQQTRTCTDLNKCGSVTNKPAETQTCELPQPSCTEKWTCKEWSGCSNGQQTRTCTDDNNCGTITNKPKEMQDCTEGQATGGPEDTIAPNATIVKGPTGIINSRMVTFSWQGNDDQTSSDELVYSYKFDDNSWTSFFSATSITFKNLKNGQHSFKVKAMDRAGNEDPSSAEVYFSVQARTFIVVGTNYGSSPQVRVFTPQGKILSQFFAYENNFRGGINVAAGDLGKDGKSEIIIAPGQGRKPEVKIYSLDGTLISSFLAYDEKFQQGVNIAIGDVDGNGMNEIITAPMAGGGPNIRIFGYRNGKYVSVAKNFMAYDSRFRGGVSVATADIEGDGTREIIVAPQSRGGPYFRIFGLRNGEFVPISPGLMAYASSFRGGINLASGDINNDGLDEIIIAVRDKGGPHVRIFGRARKGVINLIHSGFFAFSPRFRGGVTLATADIDFDNKAEIVTGVGSQSDALIRIFNNNGSIIKSEFYAYPKTYYNGVQISAGEY